jgi:hypothetical protein
MYDLYSVIITYTNSSAECDDMQMNTMTTCSALNECYHMTCSALFIISIHHVHTRCASDMQLNLTELKTA